MVKQGSPFVLLGVVDSSFKWARRSTGWQAQIGQALDVWSCKTASVTTTLAQRDLTSAAKLQDQTDISVLFVRPALYSKGARNSSPRRGLCRAITNIC